MTLQYISPGLKNHRAFRSVFPISVGYSVVTSHRTLTPPTTKDSKGGSLLIEFLLENPIDDEAIVVSLPSFRTKSSAYPTDKPILPLPSSSPQSSINPSSDEGTFYLQSKCRRSFLFSIPPLPILLVFPGEAFSANEEREWPSMMALTRLSGREPIGEIVLKWHTMSSGAKGQLSVPIAPPSTSIALCPPSQSTQPQQATVLAWIDSIPSSVVKVEQPFTLRIAVCYKGKYNFNPEHMLSNPSVPTAFGLGEVFVEFMENNSIPLVTDTHMSGSGAATAPSPSNLTTVGAWADLSSSGSVGVPLTGGGAAHPALSLIGIRSQEVRELRVGETRYIEFTLVVLAPGGDIPLNGFSVIDPATRLVSFPLSSLSPPFYLLRHSEVPCPFKWKICPCSLDLYSLLPLVPHLFPLCLYFLLTPYPFIRLPPLLDSTFLLRS